MKDKNYLSQEGEFMFSVKAAAAISADIATFKLDVETEWRGPSECVDFPAWIEVLEEFIFSEINGLKKIYFDNGDISLYPATRARLEHEWSLTKKHLLDIVKNNC